MTTEPTHFHKPNEACNVFCTAPSEDGPVDEGLPTSVAETLGAYIRPLDVLHRQVIYDIATNAKDLAEGIGLSPITDEGDTVERTDSLRRLRRVNILAPAIEDHARFLASVFTRIHKEGAAAMGVPVIDVEWEKAYENLFHEIHVSEMSLVALLVDLGSLHLDSEREQPSEHEGPRHE